MEPLHFPSYMKWFGLACPGTPVLSGRQRQLGATVKDHVPTAVF